MKKKNDIVIKIKNISKKFNIPTEKTNTFRSYFLNPFHRSKTKTFRALKSISLNIKKGEFIGIIGDNGSGKSTLLKIIAGIYTPDKGEIIVNGKIVPFLELGVGFNPELSGRENIFLNGTILGMKRKFLEKKFNDIIEFAGLEKFMDLPLKNYSSGMQVRLAFSIAIQTKADIYLLDEILSVGDASFQEKCLDKVNELKSKGATIIFVSHSLETIKSFCSKVIWLDDGKIKSVGSADKVVSDYIQSINKETEKKKSKIKPEIKNQIIKKVEFLKNDKPTYYFKTGDKFTARIYYYSDKKIKNPVFGVALYRDDGIHISGPNTKASGKKLKMIKGKGYINFIIDELQLKNGHYLFSIAIFDSECKKVYDSKDKAFDFRVKGGKQDTPYGLIHLKHKWELTQNKEQIYG